MPVNETFKAGDLVLIRPGANLHTEGSPRPMTWKTVEYQTNVQPALVVALHRPGPSVDERGNELVVLTCKGRILYVFSSFVAHVNSFDGEVLAWRPVHCG